VGLAWAAARLRRAAATHEKVLIFGDYDADGICATAVLWQSLHELGCEARPFIPDRFRHGYGLTLKAFEEATADFQPDLVVTVDNGIVAFPVLEELAAREISVIITDHHQPEHAADGSALYPPAAAIVHSTMLCGTTVAWMLSHELTPDLATTQLDLCAVATVADLVSLTGANRSFVFHGLKTLQQTSNLGIQELLKAARITPETCTTQTIGYMLGPRINAMGRLAQGMDALRLLCTRKQATAERLARLLDVTNGDRQALTDDLFQEAIAQAELLKDERIIVVHSASFHEGVVGLIAGKLVEKYHKPAIALSVHESVAKASARSVPGVNIVELIRLVRAELLEVGGHPMAAGFGVLTEKIELVRGLLQDQARALVLDEHLERQLQIDCQLPLEMVTPELVKALTKCEPFGKDNEPALFALADVRLASLQTVGKEGVHAKLVLTPADELESSNDDQVALTALYWRGAARLRELRPGSICTVAGMLEWNVWNGKKSVQMVVRDIKT
jgi:single-stranded-DNA-specific exonuclease